MKMKSVNLLIVVVLIFISYTATSEMKFSNRYSNNFLSTKHAIMNNQNYSTTILVEQSPKEVYNAINQVRKWWSEEIEGPTDQLNKEWFYHYQDIHLCKVKVIELVPEKKVVWEVRENSFNFIEDKSEWVGNHMVFDIAREGDKTRLTFTQEGLTEFYECFKVCRDGWDNYINNSLYHFITTGKGEPNPKEGDGFNKKLAEKWQLN